jgi:DNA-directed RNA polymerase specialized sigma24 family protein
MAYRYARGPEEREEMVQAAAFALWRRKPDPDTERRVILNAFVQHIRTQIAWRKRRDHCGSLCETSYETHPQEVYDVPFLMGLLTDRQREAIHLRFWEGLDTREVARRLGIGSVCVSSHTQNGLKRLRAYYLGEINASRDA